MCASIRLFSVEETEKQNPMDPSYLLTVISKLESGENVVFIKFGDGEYICMAGLYENKCNCDGDSYHPWLNQALTHAFVELCKKPNVYLGKWWTPEIVEFFNSIAQKNGVTIPWTWYHLVLNDDHFFEHDYMQKFVKFVVNTNRKKILICNQSNARLKDFFKADVLIEIPPRSWSYEYDKWKSIVEQHVEDNAMILIMAGMCSKVLINDLTDKYKLTCIDLGSSFDLLGSKRASRDHRHSYEQEVAYYKDFLPENWDK